MSSVIPIAENHNIPISAFFRAGVPSKAFAEKYSAICEKKGLRVKINEINRQINIITKIIEYRKLKENIDIEILPVLNKTKEKFNRKNDLLNSLINSNETKINYEQRKNEIIIKVKNDDSNIVNYQSQIDNLQITLNEKEIKLSELLKKQKEFLTKILRFLNKNDVENHIKDLTNDIASIEINIKQNQIFIEKSILSNNKYKNELAELIKNKNDIEQRIKEMNIELDLINQELEQLRIKLLTPSLIELYQKHNINQNLGNNFNNNTIKNFENDLENLIKKYLNIDKIYNERYIDFSTEQLADLIEKYEKEKSILSEFTLESRLDYINALGITLDSYIARFKEKPLNFDHYFIA